MAPNKIKTWVCRGELGYLCDGNPNPQWLDTHLGEPLKMSVRGMYMTSLCFRTRNLAMEMCKWWNAQVRTSSKLSQENKKAMLVHPVKVCITMEEI